MSLKKGGRRRTRSVRRAPRRRMTFKKLNNEMSKPFSAVLGTLGLRKPIKNVFKSVRASLGGSKKCKTYKKKC